MEGLPAPPGPLPRRRWAGALEGLRLDPSLWTTLSVPGTSLLTCVSPSPPRFELVKKLLPEEYHKVLVNIRKAESRAKKHRALNQAAVEEEEEEEEEPVQGKGDR